MCRRVFDCVKTIFYLSVYHNTGVTVNRDVSISEARGWVAITVLNVKKQKIGWSPTFKKSVYINDSTDPEIIPQLKRVREVDLVTAYDQENDKTLYIELKEPERKQFDTIYFQYLDGDGQMYYIRTKEGRMTHTLFRLDVGQTKKNESEVPKKRSLFQ